MKTKPLGVALSAAGVLVATTAGAFTLPHWFGGDNDKTQVAAIQAPPQNAPVDGAIKPNAPEPVPMLADGQVPNYREIVKRSGPAVVGVMVAGMHKTSNEVQGLPPGMENDPFFRFFRGMPGYQGRGGNSQGTPFRGQGSGFIVSKDGLILTNAHVVREAKTVTVKLADRTEYEAKVLGSDPITDVAVLKIDADNLPTVRLGDPSHLEVGDPVMAIGAPYGLEQSATQGIVSAKGRSLPGDSAVPFIQTDAAVNPGNSGGPLFDGNGNVIGINAQIYSQSGGFQGLSFAIPIDVALSVKDQVVATGKVEHGRLGVTIQELNQGLAESFGLERPDGALVSQVAPDSAAAAAGLKSGDVITAVNGKKISRSVDLSSSIGMMAPGTKIDLTVWRDHGEKELTAKLGSSSDDDQVASATGHDDSQGGRIGLALRPLSPQERQQAQIDHGMVIMGAQGPSAEAGISSGDVLLAINGKPVDSVDQVRDVLKQKPKSVALLVMRDGERIFVPVDLG